MSMRILVVDDEDVVRTVISQVLSDEGYEVVEASSGEKALELIRNQRFPLIMTDIYMGKVTGIDLLEQVRATDPECLVVVMTSNASLETATAALRAGAHDYLTKPFEDIDLISAVVNRAADRIQLLADNRSLLERLRKNAEELERANEKLKQMAHRDGLTGLYNHRFFQHALIRELESAPANGHVFSLLFMDIDHFKHYNDLHGHLVGDALLRTVGEILTSHTANGGVAARYGGEEFVLLLPRAGREVAIRLGEAIREAVAAHPFKEREDQPLGKVTLSIGIASYPDDGNTSASLVDRADKALYRAKNQGRNMLCCWAEVTAACP